MGMLLQYQYLGCPWCTGMLDPLNHHCNPHYHIYHYSQSGFVHSMKQVFPFCGNFVLREHQSKKDDTSISSNKNKTYSSELTAENDQHDPHCPWSLTSVTAPCVRQSTDDGRAMFAGSIKNAACSLFVKFLPLKPFMTATNSWCN